MYESIHSKIFSLPAEVLVYPGAFALHFSLVSGYWLERWN